MVPFGFHKGYKGELSTHLVFKNSGVAGIQVRTRVYADTYTHTRCIRSAAALTTDHKHGGLKQCKLTILHLLYYTPGGQLPDPGLLGLT